MQGHIKRVSKNVWDVVLYLGRDAVTGKRQYKWRCARGSKRDAQRERTRLLGLLNDGAYVEPSKVTLAVYLGRWLADYAKNSVSAKTYERYAEIVDKHLIPAIGGYRLAKLQPLHIQGYYSKALDSGRRNGKGGLATRTVLHHHRVLREALQRAIKWQLLTRNPAQDVEAPRSLRRETKVLDEAATVALINKSKSSRLRLPIVLAATTGMRRGEILALRWQDVDLVARTLAVQQSLEETKAGIAFKHPKTAKGRRMITLPDLTVAELRRHKAEQAKGKLLLRTAYRDNDLVCATLDGSPWAPSKLTGMFADNLKRWKLAQIRFHDLRHTHASQLLRAGIHPKIVSERLGHSTVGLTLDTYSHVLPGLQEEAARKIDLALGGKIAKL